MKLMVDGRTFERSEEIFVFTKDPLVTLPCLTEYWIDGEPVEEKSFWKEVEVARASRFRKKKDLER